ELLNLDEALLDALQRFNIEISHGIIFGIPEEAESYDLCFVEGSVASEEDKEKLTEIRGRSRVLVALGSCAGLGGIPGLRRFAGEQEVRRIYGGVELEHRPLNEAAPLSKFVRVDYHLRGCPVNRAEFTELLSRLYETRWFKQGQRRLELSREETLNIDGVAVTLDGEKCIVCGTCVKVCEGITSAIDYAHRSVETVISTPFETSFEDSLCISCGQCTLYCPVAALREKSSVKKAQRLLKTKSGLTAYVEPEVIAALGEARHADGEIAGKLATALKRLGFGRTVLWTPPSPRASGDGLLIVPSSEAEARLIRLLYPGLVGYMTEPPKLEDNNAVWFTPCVARKLGTELALTTRELAMLVNNLELDLLPDSPFDEVMLTEPSGEEIVASGMEQVKKTLEEIGEKKLEKGRVRLYVCPGGCLQGGGQPFMKQSVETKRGEALARLKAYAGSSPMRPHSLSS
ncbi:MAG: 4Fe-4S binding protein, partial [Candidatus Bathyarchaeia archaeon]